MAISNDVITNRLDKKINYGVARTEFADVRVPTNEPLGSPIFNPTSDLWINDHNIPDALIATTLSTDDMKVYQYVNGAPQGESALQTVGVLELVPAAGTNTTFNGDYATYIAADQTSNPFGTRLQDWIPFGFYGATYLTNFAIADSGYHKQNVNLSSESSFYQQIFPDTSGEEYYFDTDAGTLTFAGTSVPSALTSGRSIYLIKGARYYGPKGLTNLSLTGLNEVYPTNIQNGDILVWDSTQTKWVNSASGGGGGSAETPQSIVNKLVQADGAGTGIDSDKLDGQEGSFYQDPTNINFSNTTPLSVANVSINSLMSMESQKYTAVPQGTIVVDSFSINTYRTAKYLVTIADINDDSYYLTEVLLLQNGTESTLTQFGELLLGIGSASPDISSDIVGASGSEQCRLKITTGSDNQEITVSRFGTTT